MNAEQHQVTITTALRWRAGAALPLKKIQGKGHHLRLVHSQEEPQDKLRVALAVTLSKQAELLTPEAPRYDEVYQQGLAWLESAASLVVRNAQEEVVLVADVVQHRSVQLSAEQMKHFGEGFGGAVQFLLLADLEIIEIFSAVDGHRLHSFETREIIHHYDATAETPYAYYLTSLVEAWLSDLLSQWKSPSAPKKAELVESGLLAVLAGSSVERL